MTSADLQSLYATWARRFPIVSIEDGFGEHDWDAFRTQTATLGRSIQIVGDDLYVTNPKLIERGIAQDATNAVLIKLNQIGTVTETIAAVSACRAAGWNYVVSHRSGETDDAFIADFAVAMGGGQIKAGAPCRMERLAKYNRLLQIEREVAGRSIYVSPFSNQRIHARTETAAIRNANPGRHNIVAVLEEASSAQRCLNVALRAADLVKSASLTGLHICVDPNSLIAGAEEVDLQIMRQQREGLARQRLLEARNVFENWVASSGANAKWHEHVGDVMSWLISEAQDATMIVIAQPHNLDSADAFHTAVFNTGLPVLFVPTSDLLSQTLGSHVAIAWKARTQARKAVLRAIPWLKAAQHVTVIVVDEPGIAPDPAEVLNLLKDQGVAANVRRSSAQGDQHIAAGILAEVESLGADSLVMGAFRFGQLFEWAFGGVTQEVLKKTRVPIFMMH